MALQSCTASSAFFYQFKAILNGPTRCQSAVFVLVITSARIIQAVLDMNVICHVSAAHPSMKFEDVVIWELASVVFAELCRLERSEAGEQLSFSIA